MKMRILLSGALIFIGMSDAALAQVNLAPTTPSYNTMTQSAPATIKAGPATRVLGDEAAGSMVPKDVIGNPADRTMGSGNAPEGEDSGIRTEFENYMRQPDR